MYLVRRQIMDPSILDLQQAAEAIRQCDRLQLWEVLSRGVDMRVTLPSGTSRPRGAVGMVASSDPLTDAGGGSNPRWSTGKAQDFQRPG